MTTKMLINAVDEEEYRVALIKDGQLDGYYLETTSAEEITRNIYKGVLTRVEPSLQACFVDFGGEKNGFLQASEIHPEYYLETVEQTKEDYVPPIKKIVKKGQQVLVQVTREMPGRKGAHLTTYISLASRFLVLTPGRPSAGISKKIDDEERQRLKSITKTLSLPEGVGIIVRTAAHGRNKRELSKDLNRILRMWKSIKTKAKKVTATGLIYKEQDVCLRTLRDNFTSEISEVLVDNKEIFGKVRDYMKIISPRHQRRVKYYKEKIPIFAQYAVEKEIETIYSNRVPLKSGGSVVIDSTEALISIDVNSGRSMRAKDVEGTAFKTNMEAALEIARQLRLRDLGGLIVIDFIDMRDRNHIRDVEKTLREQMKKDRAKTDVSHISKFGLLELSRQRLRPSIESRSYQTCEYCQGRGLVLSVESASVSYLRQIWMGASNEGVEQVRGLLPLEVFTYLQNKKRKELTEIESRYGVEVILEGDPTLSPGAGHLNFLKGKEGT